MNLTELRDTLANFYQEKRDAQRVVDDAGIRREVIDFDTNTRNIWHQILSEAQKSNKLQQLIEVVSKDYDSFRTYDNEITLADTTWSLTQIQEETLFSLTIWKITLAIIITSLFLKRRPARRVIVSITIASLFFILLVRWPETVQTIKRIYDNLKTIIEAPGPLPPVELPSPTPTPEAVIATPALSITVTSEPAVQAIPAPIITPDTGRPQPIATAGNAPVSIPVQRNVTPSFTPTPKTITATIIPFAGYICMLCQKSLNEGKSADDSNSTCNICEKFSKIPVATFVFITPPIQVTSIYTQATATSQAATPTPMPSFTATSAETLRGAASSLTPLVESVTYTPTIATDTPVTDTPTPSSTPTSTPSLTLTPETPATITETATATPSLTPVVAPATAPPSPTPPSQPTTDTPTVLPTATPEAVTETATLPPPATEGKAPETPTSLPPTTTEPPTATPVPPPTPTTEPVIPTATPLPQPTSEPVVPTATLPPTTAVKP